MVPGLWYTLDKNFGSLSRLLRCKEHPCPLSRDLGFWRTWEVPEWDLASWSLFWYGQWSLVHPGSKFWLSILILKLQRTSISLKSWLEPLRILEVPDWGLESWSWFGYGHLSLKGLWHLAWALAFGLGFDSCSSLSRKYVVCDGFGFGVCGSGSAEVKDWPKLINFDFGLCPKNPPSPCYL